jgi:hypothetical protein
MLFWLPLRTLYSDTQGIIYEHLLQIIEDEKDRNCAKGIAGAEGGGGLSSLWSHP